MATFFHQTLDVDGVLLEFLLVESYDFAESWRIQVALDVLEWW